MRRRLDRLLSSDRFRTAATAFPLFRPIARRRARAVFALCGGFVRSQVLLAVLELDLPALLLREGPLDAATIAERAGLSPARLDLLLRAAAGCGLLRERGRDGTGRIRWGLGPMGAVLNEDPGLRAMVAHHRALYADLADPVRLLREDAGSADGGALRRFWDYRAANPEAAARWSALMGASQPMIAREAMAAVRFGRFRRVLDVGGGDGSFLCALLERHPRLHGAVFDLPPVAALAAERFSVTGLSGRAAAISGNFLSESLPSGFDAVILNRIVHDHDDPAVRILFAAIHAALPPGGTLLLVEPTGGSDPDGRAVDAYFAPYLLAMGSGRPRRVHELGTLLRQAGFRAVHERRGRLPLIARVVQARR